MAFKRLSRDAQLSKGDLVLLRYEVPFIPGSVQRQIASFVARFNQEKPIQLFDYELAGNPVFNPADGTLNVLVRVQGTPLLAIIVPLATILAIVFGAVLLKDALLVVVEETGEAIGDIGEGFKEFEEKTGKGLGIGLAVAGIVAGLVAVGAINLRSPLGATR